VNSSVTSTNSSGGGSIFIVKTYWFFGVHLSSGICVDLLFPIRGSAFSNTFGIADSAFRFASSSMCV
jgi:hypothetical protein